MDKLQELQARLDLVNFYRLIVESDDPFKKSLKAPTEQSLKDGLSSIKSFLKKEIDNLLDSSSKKLSIELTEGESLILKALLKKYSDSPKVQQVLSETTTTTKTEPDVLAEAKPLPKKKMIPTKRGNLKMSNDYRDVGENRLGAVGSIIDPESILGPAANHVNYKDKVKVIGQHGSMNGYWQCQLVDNPALIFAVEESAVEWE